LAVYLIGEAISEDIDRVSSNHHGYDPNSSRKSFQSNNWSNNYNRPGSNSRRPRQNEDEEPFDAENAEVESMNIPGDMVGCIIGKGGAFINQIRRVSGSKLHIADQVENSIERVVTITGSNRSNKMAIALVKDQLEAESIRRESKVVEGITR
jgi:hypothetical protein